MIAATRFACAKVFLPYLVTCGHLPAPSRQSLVGIATRAMSVFSYTHAITREIPRSFVGALRLDESKSVDYDRAVQQFQNYKGTLKKCGLEVISVPADEKLPDCVFVEDTALVIGNKACLMRPGHPTRRAEVQAMKEALQRLNIKIMEPHDPSALIDGGDIIFTGQEILVGESTRTNKAGVEGLQQAFPEFPVTSIPVEGTLHLKSVASLGDEGLLVVGGSEAAANVLKSLKQRAKGQYKYVQLDSDEAANVLYLNRFTFIKPQKAIGPSNFKKLTEAISVPCLEVDFDEFYKVDGCLTCCCVLVRAPDE